MIEFLYRRLGCTFIPCVLGFTRMFAITAGMGCVLYVNYSLHLAPNVRTAFVISAILAIAFAAVVTFAVGLQGSRELRRLIRFLHQGTIPGPELLKPAVRQAVMFPFLHTRREARLDPWITIAPICLSVKLFSDAPWVVVIQIVVAGFLGLACILLLTFFLTERCLRPVVLDLLSRGIPIDFDAFPATSLKRRLKIGFAATILVTAVMIGGLSLQRSGEMARDPILIGAHVAALRRDILLISLLAVGVGVGYSQVVAGSVTQRTSRLVEAMRLVEDGNYTINVPTAGTDEIDILSRRFNRMVRELGTKDSILRALTESLEQQVADRTSRLSLSLSQMERLHQDLQRRNAALEITLTQLKQTQNQLIHSEKMTSLGQLVAGLAHEINNSVNAVHNGLPPLLAKVETMHRVLDSVSRHLPESDKEVVRRARGSIDKLSRAIQDGVDRTTRIVRSMKQYSHPGTDEQTPLHLQDVIDRCISLIHVSTRRSIAVQTEYRHTRLLTGPYSQLDQVFMNLLSNAFDALGDNGEVRIDTADDDEQGVVIRFRDNGPGMPPEIRRRIFDPFFTTKPPGKGTGLGLSVSFRIVEAAGGTMVCDSEPGRGTTFTIHLPNLSEAGEPSAICASSPAPVDN